MVLTTPTKSALAWTKAFVVPSIWRAAIEAEPPLNSSHPCAAATALQPFDTARRPVVAINAAAGARRSPARKPFRFFMEKLL
jgi:hypothetical protein